MSELQQINIFLKKSLTSSNAYINQSIDYIINNGGKRLRAILTIKSALLCDPNISNKVLNLATAIELLHTASLIHDDVIDNANIRRNKPSINAKWSNKLSIATGNWLFAKVFEIISALDNKKINQIISQVANLMTNGEIIQSNNQQQISIDEQDYFKAIYAKTAILFEAAMSTGAIINNANAIYIKALKDYGKHLGIAFQIKDDLLDYQGSEASIGKKIGKDFYDGKITLPLLYYLKNTKKPQKNYNNIISGKLKFEQVLDDIYKYNIINKCSSLIEDHIQLAFKALHPIPNCQIKAELIEIAKKANCRNN